MLSPALIPTIILAAIITIAVIYEIVTGYSDAKPSIKANPNTDKLAAAGFIFDQLPAPLDDQIYEVITITIGQHGEIIYNLEKDIFLAGDNSWKSTQPIAWRKLT